MFYPVFGSLLGGECTLGRLRPLDMVVVPMYLVHSSYSQADALSHSQQTCENYAAAAGAAAAPCSKLLAAATD